MNRFWSSIACTALMVSFASTASAKSCAKAFVGYELCYEGDLPHKIIKTAAGFHITIGDRYEQFISGTFFPNADWEDEAPADILTHYFEGQKSLADNGNSYRAKSYGQFQTGPFLSSVYILSPKRRMLGLLPPADFLKPAVESHTYVDGKIFFLTARSDTDAKGDDLINHRRQIIEMLRKTSKEN